jgi:hypothetical protein
MPIFSFSSNDRSRIQVRNIDIALLRWREIEMYFSERTKKGIARSRQKDRDFRSGDSTPKGIHAHPDILPFIAKQLRSKYAICTWYLSFDIPMSMQPNYARGFPQAAQRSPATPRRGPPAPGRFAPSPLIPANLKMKTVS